jgi:hypothetical protein
VRYFGSIFPAEGFLAARSFVVATRLSLLYQTLRR